MVKVLIIDDDPFDSGLLASSFRTVSEDAEVTIVNDSNEACNAYNDVEPDLTLLDLNMPPPDGFVVLEALNGIPSRKNKSLIMLSGSTNPMDKQKAVEGGADGYRVKPSTLESYRGLASELVNSLCGKGMAECVGM